MALRIYKDSLKSDKKQVANNLRRKSHGMNKVKSGLKNPVALMDTDFVNQRELKYLRTQTHGARYLVEQMLLMQ